MAVVSVLGLQVLGQEVHKWALLRHFHSNGQVKLQRALTFFQQQRTCRLRVLEHPQMHRGQTKGVEWTCLAHKNTMKYFDYVCLLFSNENILIKFIGSSCCHNLPPLIASLRATTRFCPLSGLRIFSSSSVSSFGIFWAGVFGEVTRLFRYFWREV